MTYSLSEYTAYKQSEGIREDKGRNSGVSWTDTGDRMLNLILEHRGFLRKEEWQPDSREG